MHGSFWSRFRDDVPCFKEEINAIPSLYWSSFGDKGESHATNEHSAAGFTGAAPAELENNSLSKIPKYKLLHILYSDMPTHFSNASLILVDQKCIPNRPVKVHCAVSIQIRAREGRWWRWEVQLCSPTKNTGCRFQPTETAWSTSKQAWITTKLHIQLGRPISLLKDLGLL